MVSQMIEPKVSKKGFAHVRLAEGTTGYADLYYSTKESHELARVTCFVTKTFFAKEKYESVKEYKQRVLKEFNILRGLDHENIIKAYKVKEGGLMSPSKIVIYLEAGASVNLLRLIQKHPALMSNGCAYCYWRQIVNAVAYLHSENICHRDLKLENVVLDRNHIAKLIDFGLAFNCSPTNELAIGSVGSPAYMAPEQLSSIRYDGKKADIWSLGSILYYMLVRKYPWKMATHSDVQFQAYVSHHREVKSNGAVNNRVKLDCSSVRLLPLVPVDSDRELLRIFDPDPVTRISAQELADSEWVCLLPFCHQQVKCNLTHRLPLSFC